MKRKVVSRRELAVRYFESTNPRQSVARMLRWIQQDPTLRRALHKAGYRQNLHYLPAAVARVFARFMG